MLLGITKASLSTDSFTWVADLVRRRSAIQLAAGKEYLVESRLLPLARADVAADATVVAAVNGVQRTLTTADLATLIKAVDTGGSAPDQAAGRWLQAKGLA